MKESNSEVEVPYNIANYNTGTSLLEAVAPIFLLKGVEAGKEAYENRKDYKNL